MEKSSPATTSEQIPKPKAAANADESANGVGESFIVDDAAEQVEPGQMRKGEFLAQLKASICSAADEQFKGTAWSVGGCPWIDHWFGYYETRSAAHLEAGIHKYIPGLSGIGAARDYIPALTDRVRSAIGVWVHSGRVTGVPGGTPLDVPTKNAAAAKRGAIMPKAKEGGFRDVHHPAAVQAQLGAGNALEGSIGTTMGTALGGDFSNVRVHTDPTAQELASQMNAKAFTVGNHVAFGSGEYRPGTLHGDGLIAHELAHVVQQKGVTSAGGGAGYGALEADAERATAGALQQLWGGNQGAGAKVNTPAMSSGLTLQRCRNNERVPQTDKEQSPPAQAPAQTEHAEQPHQEHETQQTPLAPQVQLPTVTIGAITSQGAPADNPRILIDMAQQVAVTVANRTDQTPPIILKVEGDEHAGSATINGAATYTLLGTPGETFSVNGVTATACNNPGLTLSAYVGTERVGQSAAFKVKGIQWQTQNFTITHYTYAMENDPAYANDPMVDGDGLNEQHRRGFLFGNSGIRMQGTGLASDGQYITLRWRHGRIDGFTYGQGRPNSVPWHTIAVDPAVIPLNSQVVIEHYADRGTFLANDTGGAINGHHIDVFVGAVPLSEARALGTTASRVGIVQNPDC